ncbi:BH4-AAA-HYDROXYL-2 domain-containing protein [Aphelenchoides besseyi]|nr:BH4-AAA-HYDROXYL-2 domain-containing protein [Aphelenchoides besseyi]
MSTSAMKFVYYNHGNEQRSDVPDAKAPQNKPIEEFKRRFRRSGSVGVPFVSEEDARELKTQKTIDETDEPRDEEKGITFLAFIVKTEKTPQAMGKVMSSMPKGTEVKHIESRDPKPGVRNEIEVFVEVELKPDLEAETLLRLLRACGFEVHEVSQTLIPLGAEEFRDPGSEDALSGCPWFPKSIKDLDICAKRVIMYGAGLDADHPGFKDEEYRKRRMMFADIALSYKHGEPIPRIEHTDREKQTWKIVYTRLRELHLKHACKEFLDNFELLERYCGYSPDNIPQLDDVSNFLREKTGFRLRPVAGYLSARDFLAGLAFRVFNCTQYIRHHEQPAYSPEPDTVHELMGHMALFADPDFAQFSQEIGLASLGASEEDLSKLATLYFFSIEFGLCSGEPPNNQKKQLSSASSVTPTANGGIATADYKIYGAGLLSSAGELKHAVEDKPQILRFDPDRVVQQECLITTFQEAYFYTRNFEEAQQKLRTFTNSMNRPFVVRYNPYTESIEVLNNKRSLMLAVNSLRSDINLLTSALHNIL